MKTSYSVFEGELGLVRHCWTVVKAPANANRSRGYPALVVLEHEGLRWSYPTEANPGSHLGKWVPHSDIPDWVQAEIAEWQRVRPRANARVVAEKQPELRLVQFLIRHRQMSRVHIADGDQMICNRNHRDRPLLEATPDSGEMCRACLRVAQRRGWEV